MPYGKRSQSYRRSVNIVLCWRFYPIFIDYVSFICLEYLKVYEGTDIEIGKNYPNFRD
jgi:hypothetical protein